MDRGIARMLLDSFVLPGLVGVQGVHVVVKILDIIKILGIGLFQLQLFRFFHVSFSSRIARWE